MYQEGLTEFGEETKSYVSDASASVINRAQYLLDRKKTSKFIYSNFSAIRNIGFVSPGKANLIRENLGDYEHISSVGLRLFSSLYLSPVFAHEFYRLGKIIGYSSVVGLARTLDPAVLKNPRLQRKKIFEAQIRSWKQLGSGNIKNMDIDRENKRLHYHMHENSCDVIANVAKRENYDLLTKPCNCIDVGVLCGQTEAILGGVWEGYETRCLGRGDDHCKIELYLQGKNNIPRIQVLDKTEYNQILDKQISLAVSPKKDNIRESVGDNMMIATSQAINYLMVTTSKGHKILSKWAGKKVGERIIRKARITDIFEALDYTKETFKDLGMGLIEYQADLEKITIRMDESVYSSGVNPIGKKLCIFLAGIIEGGLNQATNVKDPLDDDVHWIVDETKCTANGDPFCEFVCSHRDPGTLQKILVG